MNKRIFRYSRLLYSPQWFCTHWLHSIDIFPSYKTKSFMNIHDTLSLFSSSPTHSTVQVFCSSRNFFRNINVILSNMLFTFCKSSNELVIRRIVLSVWSFSNESIRSEGELLLTPDEYSGTLVRCHMILPEQPFLMLHLHWNLVL